MIFFQNDPTAPRADGATLQAADQTTLAALTLGLSFHPTTAAVSRCAPSSSSESVRIKGTRRTWVGCEAGEAGEVWSWLEEERKDGSTEGSASKIVYPVRWLSSSRIGVY